MDIAAWLRELGLERYEEAFRENEIDAELLPKLTADDLRDIGVTTVGHRRKLLEAIAALAEPALAPQAEPSAPAEAAPRARPAEAERRQLTVLFCDLVGSTELSARLDPEDMGRVIRAYQDSCAEVVERWGGHVAKYHGRWRARLFRLAAGARGRGRAGGAGRAGRSTGERLARRARRRRRAKDAARGAGRHRDRPGHGRRADRRRRGAQEQTVVGETPNLAARLQALAQPGSVVISQATRRLVGGLFELADLGPQRLKGFAEPLAAWRVEGEGRAEGRFEALHGEHLTPLVGREHELGILLERWAWAKDGDGQVVLLSGEPGIGKSRVIRTLRERLGDEPHTPLSNYCSPHHTNSALHPVIDLLERAARLDRDEPPEEQLAKLEAVLGRSSDRLDEVVPLLAALLGVPTGERYPALSLTPEVQKRRTLQALVDQLAGARGAAAGAGAVRGRALDRPVDPRALGPGDRAHPAAAGPGADHLPAGVPAALDRPGARHLADHEPSGPAPGGGSGGAGHRRQAAAGGDRRADRGAHRRRAAVRRGADQDRAGIGPARGRRRPLRAVRARCRRSRSRRRFTTP